MATLQTDVRALAKAFAHEEFVHLPVPEATPERAARIFQGLYDFEQLVPPKEQERWALLIPRAAEDPSHDDGIIRRSDKPHDRKLFAHIRRNLIYELERRGVMVPEPLAEWIFCCHELREACLRRAKVFLAALDEAVPGYDLYDRLLAAEAARNTCVLRPVKYDATDRGYTATHTDRNGLTFSIATTHPGFYVERRDGSRAYPREIPGTVVAFPGRQLEAVSRGAIRALPHGSQPVVNESRCALVCFFYLA